MNRENYYKIKLATKEAIREAMKDEEFKGYGRLFVVLGMGTIYKVTLRYY